MVISVAKEKEVVIYRVIVEVAGDPSVGIFGTTMQIVFDDGYTISNREDYDYLINESKVFVENLQGEQPRVYLYDQDGNDVWP
jgi:hypothetical protein